MFFVHLSILKLITEDISFKFLSFIKELTFKIIDLPSIFQDRSVASYIPLYFQNSEPHMIYYNYIKPIINTIFNFNNLYLILTSMLILLSHEIVKILRSMLILLSHEIVKILNLCIQQLAMLSLVI